MTKYHNGRQIYLDCNGNETVWIHYYDKGSYIGERVFLDDPRTDIPDAERPY